MAADPPVRSSPTDLRVWILAEDGFARAGLASLLRSEAGLEVVGQSRPEADSASLLAGLGVDVVLWDLGWDAGPSLEHLEDQADSLPPVIALIQEPEVAGGAWGAGARGVLERASTTPTIVAAVRAVGLGLTVAGDGLQPAAPAVSPSQELPVERLTSREHEVLQLVAQGLANKVIASRLGVTEATVKFHVNSVMRKLGAQSRTEAVVRATRMGLILL